MKRTVAHIDRPLGGLLGYLTLVIRFVRRYYLVLMVAVMIASFSGCMGWKQPHYSFWKPKEKPEAELLVEEPLRENDMSDYMGQIRNRDAGAPKREKGDWLFFSNDKSREINRNMGG